MLPRIDCNPEFCCAQWVLLDRVMLEKGVGITAEAVEAEKFISYEREMDKAIAAVDRGEAQMACPLKPVRVEQVTDIALGGSVLPQKSTDFYPKLLSGETIFRIARTHRRSDVSGGTRGNNEPLAYDRQS